MLYFQLKFGSMNMQKGISRIDSHNTHGWFVRGYKNGQTYSKLFSDGNHNSSKKESLEAAVAYHKKLIKRLEKIPFKPRTRKIVSRDKRNKSGIIGIRRLKRKTSKGKIREYFSVTWRPKPHIQKYTCFSINKYGAIKALKMAKGIRRMNMLKVLQERNEQFKSRKSSKNITDLTHD